MADQTTLKITNRSGSDVKVYLNGRSPTPGWSEEAVVAVRRCRLRVNCVPAVHGGSGLALDRVVAVFCLKENNIIY
jgi:hypothetical protein